MTISGGLSPENELLPRQEPFGRFVCGLQGPVTCAVQLSRPEVSQWRVSFCAVDPGICAVQLRFLAVVFRWEVSLCAQHVMSFFQLPETETFPHWTWEPRVGLVGSRKVFAGTKTSKIVYSCIYSIGTVRRVGHEMDPYAGLRGGKRSLLPSASPGIF